MHLDMTRVREAPCQGTTAWEGGLTCRESRACQKQAGQHRAAVPQHEPCVKQRVAMVPGHAAQADALLPESHSLLDLHALRSSLHGQGSRLDTSSLGW